MTMTPEERKLRDLLWAAHACSGKYGDDGEIQCSHFLPVIDFLRDTPKEIERKVPLHYAQLAKDQKARPLGKPDREKIARALMQQDGMNDDWFFDCRSTVPEAEETCQEYEVKANQLLALFDVEEAKKQVACDLFEEIICPMCYRLNPQHATMDKGKGCHSCQEREDWQAIKKEARHG